jgi:hypothetical protein
VEHNSNDATTQLLFTGRSIARGYLEGEASLVGKRRTGSGGGFGPDVRCQELDTCRRPGEQCGMSVEGTHAASGLGSFSGTRASSLVVTARFTALAGAIALALQLSAASAQTGGAEQAPLPPPAPRVQDTNSLEILRACRQLQEQLHATRLAIEQSRQEMKLAEAQTAEALSNALHAIDETFAAQRSRDLEAMESSNRVTLIVAGTFAALGLVTLLMVGFFQWRMSQGLAEISAALPAALGLGAQPAMPALPVTSSSPDSPLTRALSTSAGDKMTGERMGSFDAPQSMPPVPESATLAGQSELRMVGVAEQSEPQSHARGQVSPSAAKPRGAASITELRFFPSPAPTLRKPPIRALRTAVIVGLICAAGIALLFYLVTYQKLGGGYLHRLFGH